MAVRIIPLLLLTLCSVAAAQMSVEEQCLAERFKVAGRYSLCQSKVAASGSFLGSAVAYSQRGAEKCSLKHRRAWAKFQSKFPGTTCFGSRWTPTASGTVVDRLTGLEWEQKTDDGSIHDYSNRYYWSEGSGAADGTAFVTFLSALNTPPCFAGHCDWRLPTREELQTILLAPSPCNSPLTPCIDAAFGPTMPDHYVSASTHDGSYWDVDFDNAWVESLLSKGVEFYVRAVRGGL